MVNPADVHGKRIAMVAWSQNPDGSDDVAVFTGTANWDGIHLTMVRQAGTTFQLDDEWLDRIEPVESGLKPMLLDADFSFSVAVGDLPEGENEEEYVRTCLTWPKEDNAGSPDSRGARLAAPQRMVRCSVGGFSPAASSMKEKLILVDLDETLVYASEEPIGLRPRPRSDGSCRSHQSRAIPFHRLQPLDAAGRHRMDISI
jgi:hypothetical protein